MRLSQMNCVYDPGSGPVGECTAKAVVAGCKRVEVESGRQRSSGMAVRWSLV